MLHLTKHELWVHSKAFNKRKIKDRWNNFYFQLWTGSWTHKLRLKGKLLHSTCTSVIDDHYLYQVQKSGNPTLLLHIANTVQCTLAYLFLFFGHLSFQLLFHSIFIFLNFQFYCSFLLVVVFQWLDIELVYPQVKKCFQNLQQKSVKWKTWKWKSLCGALGSFSPTPKSSLDKFSLFWKDIRIRVDRGLDLMRILADVIVVTFLLISIRIIP